MHQYDKSIFINCPLDDEYVRDFLHPILFSIIQVELEPRLSSEVSDSGELRLEKIVNLIKSSKYSIHDLSKCKYILSNTNSKEKEKPEYARINMPFELGIDYGIRNSITSLKDKKFLILESKRYDCVKALSDISGWDVKSYNEESLNLFGCLNNWFSETVKIERQPPPT